MTNAADSDVPSGWVGGFSTSNRDFGYPDPNLSSLDLLGNLDNIPKLRRQQPVEWPEFSWLTIQGDESSRCFQRFAHDISRLGYDDTGRVWSIICPQQGVCDPHVGCLNVEVTVTGQRGWADESNREMAADMTVEAAIWFSPSAHDNWFVKRAWKLFADEGLPFPSTKAKAIKVSTHNAEDPDQPIFPVRKGESPRFASPDFAKHPSKFAVAHLEVGIGAIVPTGHVAVDRFNQKVLDIFNLNAGAMLTPGSVLTWNLWFESPELVDTQEWKDHAEKWRKSIDADHGPTSGPLRFADGSAFTPEVNERKELEDVLEMLEDLLEGEVESELERGCVPSVTKWAKLLWRKVRPAR